MSTTKVGTIEMWWNAKEMKMDSIVKESSKVLVSIPCPEWADKSTVAAVVEKETIRRVR